VSNNSAEACDTLLHGFSVPPPLSFLLMVSAGLGSSPPTDRQFLQAENRLLKDRLRGEVKPVHRCSASAAREESQGSGT